MLHSVASVTISTPNRYLSRLCKHLAHKLVIELRDGSARIAFSHGNCGVVAADTSLEFELDGADKTSMSRMKDVLERHLRQVAPDEHIVFTWQ